ncbi:MAG: 50S ribosomal protein L22 [Deltaproteobacteria bacterium]|jgi:large subunit ribosomal protein L22|nr:50S ribosomal protein L22 [bacterium HR37]GIW47356.1 MAG: 50S ribosomal protein L22 [Deltaproteobacteria bacterium]
MVSQALLKYAKTSPKKVRLVLDLIRGMNVEEAFTVLSSLRKKPARIVAKLLKSAVANAAEKGHTDTETLYIKEVYASQGSALKRFRPRAMGRAYMRKRRTSHIKIVLDERGL